MLLHEHVCLYMYNSHRALRELFGCPKRTPLAFSLVLFIGIFAIVFRHSTIKVRWDRVYKASRTAQLSKGFSLQQRDMGKETSVSTG